MRDFVKWEKQRSYPHQRDFEISLIERFINKFPDAYDEVAFSFPVGVPPPFDPTVNFSTGGSDEYLYQRKIDMVAKKGNTIDIIEVKKKAGISTIGQVEGYRDLFYRDEKPPNKPTCKIICESTDSDTVHVAKDKSIDIIVV